MGLAYQALGEEASAISSFQAAVQLDPTLTSAMRAIIECKKVQKEQYAKDRENFKSMFSSPNNKKV